MRPADKPTYPFLKLFTILFPPTLIGLAEYIRHEFMLDILSMEEGNVLITIIVFAMSYFYVSWMFRHIEAVHAELAEQKSRRAVYEERERLAGELHDNIAQTLFFLQVKLQKEGSEEIRAAVSDIDSHLRQAIFNLRTRPEDGVALPERLQSWLEEWSIKSGIPCRVNIRIPERFFTTGEEVHLFGIIQEAFTNIRKHSGANEATLDLETDGNRWTLVITDSGRGIEQAAVDRLPEGQAGKYGLSMMAKRAESLRAHMTIERQATGGTLIRLTGWKEGEHAAVSGAGGG